MYPVMLNINGKLCTVIGGGKVALHKVKKLSQGGAYVKVISAEFINGFAEFETITKKYSPSDIENSFLVIAATDDIELNKKIVDDSHKRNILASIADNADYSDFISPASVTSGDITLSVSTNGKFPMLAKKLCSDKTDKLNFFSGILPILEKYRRHIIKMNYINKQELLEFMLSEEMLEYAQNNTDVFRKRLQERFPH